MMQENFFFISYYSYKRGSFINLDLDYSILNINFYNSIWIIQKTQRITILIFYIHVPRITKKTF